MFDYLSSYKRTTFTPYHYTVMSDAVSKAFDDKLTVAHFDRVNEVHCKFLKSVCLPKPDLNYIQSTRVTARTITKQTANALDGSNQGVSDLAHVG